VGDQGDAAKGGGVMDPDVFRKLLGNDRWFNMCQVIGLDMEAFLTVPMQDEWCILELLFKCPVYFGEIVKQRYPDGLMSRGNIADLAVWVRVQNATDGAFRLTKPLVNKGQQSLFEGDKTCLT
jgi:hypothetical protein